MTSPAVAMGPRPPRIQELDGIAYVRIDRAARNADWTFDRARMTLRSGGHLMKLSEDRRQAEFERQAVWLHEPVRKMGRHWGLAEIDLRSVVTPLLEPDLALMGCPAGVVVLDPGHGGEDSGARGISTLEKELTLDICGRVRRILAAQDIPVRLTRTTDQFVALPERARLAAAHQAGLFVSIHFNSAGNLDAAGAETFALTAPGGASTADFEAKDRDPKAYPGNGHGPSNTLLAWNLHRHLLRVTRATDRGVRRARFAVLRDAPCPAVLIECGFLSNAAEEARILSPYYRQGIAEGIAAGIRDYIRQVQLARAGGE